MSSPGRRARSPAWPIILILAAAPPPGRAATDERPAARGANALAWSAGAVDVIDTSPRPIVSIEFRHDAGHWTPSPWMAFESTAHDQFYAFGMYGDLPFAQRWVFTPSIGAAIY